MPEHEDRLEQQLRALAGVGSRSASALRVEEVRARGSRRRQRRVAVVAGLAAAAVVAASTVAVGVGNTAQVAPATPGPLPPGGWLQEIPDDFVIDADPPPDDAGAMTRGPVEDLGVVDTTICGEQALDGSPEPVDQLGFRTALQWRGLTIYADDTAARAALTQFVERADACPSDTSTGPTGDVTASAWKVRSGRAASTTIAQTFADGGVVWYHLVLRGNGLAVVRTGTLLSQKATVSWAVARAELHGRAASIRLIGAMCVFTVEGCTSEQTPEPPPSEPREVIDGVVIPDDFALDVALEDQGDGVLQGPQPGSSPVDLTICDQSVFPAGDPSDQLGLRFTGPEWGDLRSLTTYADEATALRALDRITRAAGACNRDPSGDGQYTTWEATPFSSDRGRALLEQRYWLEGGLPTTGLTYYSLVQRGPALLVVMQYGEGGGSPSTTQAALDLVLAATAALIEEMCVFAAGRCGDDSGPSSPPQGPLTDRDLPPARELPSYDNRSDWDETATYPGEAQGSISVCQRQPLADLGAMQVFSRRYRGVAGALGGALGPGSTSLQVEAGITIAEFPDEAAAAEAYAIVRGWIDECESALDEQGFEEAVGDPLDDVEADEPTAFRVLSYRPGGSAADGTWTDGQAVVQRDNRLALVSARSRGGRLEFFPRLGTPILLMQVAVVDWLPPGNPPPGP